MRENDHEAGLATVQLLHFESHAESFRVVQQQQQRPLASWDFLRRAIIIQRADAAVGKGGLLKGAYLKTYLGVSPEPQNDIESDRLLAQCNCCAEIHTIISSTG